MYPALPGSFLGCLRSIQILGMEKVPGFNNFCKKHNKQALSSDIYSISHNFPFAGPSLISFNPTTSKRHEKEILHFFDLRLTKGMKMILLLPSFGNIMMKNFPQTKWFHMRSNLRDMVVILLLPDTIFGWNLAH